MNNLIDWKKIYSAQINANSPLAEAMDKILEDKELKNKFDTIGATWKEIGSISIKMSAELNNHFKGKSFSTHEECGKFMKDIEETIGKPFEDKKNELHKLIEKQTTEFNTTIINKANALGITNGAEIDSIKGLYKAINSEQPNATMQHKMSDAAKNPNNEHEL
jgi:hypothetical protein